MRRCFCGTFQSITVIEFDGDDGELWHVLSNFMLCSEWQNYNFFSLLLSLRTKAEFLYGALHLTDSKRHNVAIRFLIVLSNKVVISLRCVAPI
jgi:hypothetical protein